MRLTKKSVLVGLWVAAGLFLCSCGKEISEVPESRVSEWAEAFCSRKGTVLKSMYNPEHPTDFYEIELVQSQPTDDFVGFGWSSPWPMDAQYSVQTEGTETEITYYAMTSEPYRYVWKEWLVWKNAGNVWYVDEERFHEYAPIGTAEEFYEAYEAGIEGTPMDYREGEAGETLNRLAKEQKDSSAYVDLFRSEWAAEVLLNLHGGTSEVHKNGDQAEAVYTFSDGSRAAVRMVQPYGEDGIWIPAEILPKPGKTEMEGEGKKLEEEKQKQETGIQQGEDRYTAGQLTAQDVIGLAGVLDNSDLTALTEHFPSPNNADSEEKNFAWYDFVEQGEDYALQISYDQSSPSGDRSLDYIILVRVETGESLNIYRTQEDVQRYGMKLAEESDIRAFFETHRQMSDYLTYRLPDNLANGHFLQRLGNDGGNLFLTSDTKKQAWLDELSQYIERDFVPAEWYSAGYAARYTGEWTDKRYSGENLMGIHMPWNHSDFTTEFVSVSDCEAPAVLVQAEHDLYTAASLAEAEEKYGKIPEERRTSRMWYVFFGKPDCQEMYSIALNSDLYTSDEVLKIARSVHFTEQAWTEEENLSGRIWDDFSQGTIGAISFEKLPDCQDTSGIVSLGELSGGQFRLYGCISPESGYQGICIVDWEGNVNTFDSIFYTSPRMVPPRMYWDQEREILKIAFHTLTGTSLSADQFFAFLQSDTGHLEPFEFTKEDCEKRLKERLIYRIDNANNVVTFFDGEKKIMTVRLDGLDSSRIQDVVYTEFVKYLPDGKPVMEFSPEFILDGMLTPQYPEDPETGMEADFTVMRADPETEEVAFEVGEIRKQAES